MPEVWHKIAFEGQKKAEIQSLLNSASSFVVLPTAVAKSLGLKVVGETEVELANGKILKGRKVYEVRIEITNEETGEVRKAKTYATIERRDYPLIGTMAMEKLRVIPDVVKGRVLFV